MYRCILNNLFRSVDIMNESFISLCEAIEAVQELTTVLFRCVLCFPSSPLVTHVMVTFVDSFNDLGPCAVSVICCVFCVL